MHYRCARCEVEFDTEASLGAALCPKCSKSDAVRAATQARSQRRLGIALLIVALVASIAAIFALGGRHPKPHLPGEVPLGPVDSASLAVDVKTLAAIDAGELAQLFGAPSSVEEFARVAARDASGDGAKARAVCAALQARRNKAAFVQWSRVVPRPGPPLTASKTLAAIARDGAKHELYPLEVAALAVASLRSLEVPAMLAEVYAYPGQRDVLDPSGRFGYFGVFVPARQGAPAHVYDPYGGRSGSPDKADYVVLNDAQAVGAALSLRGLARLDHDHDRKGALQDLGAAVKLLPGSPSVRCARAAVVFTQPDAVKQGEQELQTALKLREDAPRLTNRALHLLAHGDAFGAEKDLSRVLAATPDYAYAQLLQASVHLMRRERDLCRSKLQLVERLDPSIGLLPQLWAQFYAGAGDFDRAISYAKDAVKRRPDDAQPLFILARIERGAGHTADAKKHALALLDRVPAEDRKRRLQMLSSVLGASLFDSADAGAGGASPK